MRAQTYNITDNVNLRVNTLIIQGHIVFEVNSMVLNYHGIEYTMRDRVFKRYLTEEIFVSIKSIELANYLARLIYGVNMFDIYRNQVEDEHTVNELDSYVFKGENDLPRAGEVEIGHEYIEDLMRNDNHPSDEVLRQHRNQRFAPIVRTVEEITEAPIFIRVQANLNNTAPNVRTFMHGCLAFNILAHQDRFADFNTQAAIGFFNTTIRTNDLGLTTEQMNIGDYRELLRAKDATIRELRENMRTVIAQNNQLLADNRITHHKLDQIGEHMTKFTDFIGDSLGEFNLTTASAKYVYLVIDRPSLVNEARENHTIDANQYLFDSICCLKINRAKELRAHNYDEHNDHIIIEYNCSCSLDISKWIKRHFNENNCSVINTGRYIRKIRFNVGLRNEVIESIQRFLHRSQATKQTILEHIENMEDILEVQNSQIQELREQINQIRTLLNEHRPNAVSVLANGRYRELITQADGSIVYVPRARSSEIELTEEDIRNLKFKDANGRFVNYRE